MKRQTVRLVLVAGAGIVVAGLGLWAVTTRPGTTPRSTTRRDLPADIPVIPAERRTIVPDEVQAGWTAVRLMVQDRQGQSTNIYVVKLGQAFAIPDSGLTVTVAEFLPDLMISGAIFTSASNEPKNPAVRVTVREHGREVFNGWLSALFPTIHPFQHERFGIFLKDGIRS